jgi:hypothetical protein
VSEIYVVAGHLGIMTANGQNKGRSGLMPDEMVEIAASGTESPGCHHRELCMTERQRVTYACVQRALIRRWRRAKRAGRGGQRRVFSWTNQAKRVGSSGTERLEEWKCETKECECEGRGRGMVFSS